MFNDSNNAIGSKARRIRRWANDYYKNGAITTSNRGKHSKVLSPLDVDEVREDCLMWLRNKNKNALSSNLFQQLLDDYLKRKGFLAEESSISLTTTQAWLHKLNFKMWEYKKGLYYDGHEREDVVQNRQQFLVTMEAHERRVIKYEYNDETKINTITEPELLPGEKKLVMVVHDECCFNYFLS
jgi:hypothetical protein